MTTKINTANAAIKMTKDERISVYENTIKIVKKGNYVSPLGEEITIQNGDKMVNGTKFYTKQAHVDFNSLSRFNTKIKVINKDCLMAAKELENPVVLNMASFSTPGGGVLRGSAAQEENIFRRTNLFQSLYMFNNIGDNYGIKQKEERYPLDYNFGGIYTPFVTVFRDSEDCAYEYRNEPFTVAVVSVSALKRPTLTSDNKLQPWAVETLKNKVRQILSIALENGHTNIVLSAFGCGAYGTPPSEMAKIFKEILQEDNFRGAFENVVFAIIDDHNAYNTHNPKGNFKPFKKIFDE